MHEKYQGKPAWVIGGRYGKTMLRLVGYNSSDDYIKKALEYRRLFNSLDNLAAYFKDMLLSAMLND